MLRRIPFVPLILVEGHFPQRTGQRTNLFASLFHQELSQESVNEKNQGDFCYSFPE